MAMSNVEQLRLFVPYDEAAEVPTCLRNHAT